MLNLVNKRIDIVGEKNGKKIFTKTIRNRLVDNVLDFNLYYILPNDIGSAMYSKFAGLTPLDEALNNYTYVNFNNSNTLDDTSTSILYDIKAAGAAEVTLEGNTRIMQRTYSLNVSGITNGTTFKEVGFGLDDSSASDFLFAYVDISALSIAKQDDVDYKIYRYDEINTSERLVSGDFSYLPGSTNPQYSLNKIIMAGALNGGDCEIEYSVDDLTFTYDDIGKIDITDFDKYYIEENVLYPATDLYPAIDLYPTQCYEKIKSVVFQYKGIYDETLITETYINLNDLDTSYNGTTMSIKLNCERGEY